MMQAYAEKEQRCRPAARVSGPDRRTPDCTVRPGTAKIAAESLEAGRLERLQDTLHES